ncbi:MAG: 6,7-dimethyl-8-ribityllumazine synthase [Flavobacteriia bacterium]|nr:6,7-dimethyl-8-ribityllumazine synthase [Flavobacteriia bacterium]
MATEGRPSSSLLDTDLQDSATFNIGIVVSEWNEDITNALLEGALVVFKNADANIMHLAHVPGAFELPVTAQMLLTKDPKLDGILVIGSVIQGETRHFDFVCQGVTQGIMDVMLKFNKPISFCVLTDLNLQQSVDRSGGKHGNKGTECAVTLLKMIHLQKAIQ